MKDLHDINCTCNCHQDPCVILDRTQTAVATSLLIVLLIGVFCAGYLMGKKAAVDMFTHDVNEQSFADRLHHSMTTLYGTEQSVLDGATNQDGQNKEEVTTQDLPAHAAIPHPKIDASAQTAASYYAQLMRSNVQKDAQVLVARLQKRGIATTIVKRVSSGRSRDGKPITKTWYTVNTASYTTRPEVEALISSIKITEPSLKKVQILQTKNRTQ
ncbi:MAG TPA: SPOR domain-containing protein [Candidatus Babeliales bacterium]|nr:SPOR domain-containing protein [Candidatus Babeliales bacterium]